MSLDGKIATYTGDSRMSSVADLRRVHRLRASVDAIMVGLRTLLTDDPKLTVKYYNAPNPCRVIVDSNARTPLNSYLVRTAETTPTVIAVTSKAPAQAVERLEKKGVTVLVCGNGPKVSLKILLKKLRTRGTRRLLLEGGGELNWNMLSQGLVDEISVAITPRIIGGNQATTLAEGKGSALVKNGVKLKLTGSTRYGPDLVVKFKVMGTAD